MNWKDRPGWFKSGIVFAVLHALIAIFTSLWSYKSTAPNMLLYFLDLPIALFLDSRYAPLINQFYLSNSNYYFIETFLVIVAGTVQWFIIGAVLGWVYGKIKQKMQN